MTSTATGPVPIVICGKTFTVGQPVAEALKPDFEVIHFCHGYEAAVADLPSVLAGKGPQTPTSDPIATHNYNNPPRAVVLGRAFEPDQVEELRKLCKGSNSSPVIWLPGHPEKKPTGTTAPADYPKEVARDVANILNEWLKSDAKEDEVKFF